MRCKTTVLVGTHQLKHYCMLAITKQVGQSQVCMCEAVSKFIAHIIIITVHRFQSQFGVITTKGQLHVKTKLRALAN